MKKMNIIPAMDLMDGKLVRLRKGDFSEKTTYGEDPVAMAQAFAEAGVCNLHMVDLDGARKGSPANLATLEAVCSATDLKVDFGGGLRRRVDVEAALSAGAVQVSIGSIAMKQPEQLEAWIAALGADKFILGADARGGMVAASGWQEGMGQPLTDFIAYWLERGLVDVLCTSIERDGMLTGPDIDLYKDLIARFPGIQLIASGGVANAADLVALEAAGLPAAIVGKAFYEGRITLAELGGRC